MTTLVLVRHAKSDWGSEVVADHDRPLNNRGMHDAPKMAARLAESGFVPDVILSSTALRARTTAAFFAAALGVELELQDRLYGASSRVLTAAAVEAGAPAVLIVAHDPGLSILASDLAPGISAMPTCAVARFDWETDDWNVATAIDPTTWSFATPR